MKTWFQAVILLLIIGAWGSDPAVANLKVMRYLDRTVIGSDEFVGIPGETRSMPQSLSNT